MIDALSKAFMPTTEAEKAQFLLSKGITDIYAPRSLHNFEGVRRHKSVWRAMRRGKVSLDGECFPYNPFNNRKPTEGRELNNIKRQIHGQFKQFTKLPS